MVRLALVAALVLAPSVARADGGTLGTAELAMVFDVDSGAHDPGLSLEGLASVHVTLSRGTPHLRYVASLDAGLGFTIGGLGFAYDGDLLPAGVGLQLGTPEHIAFLGVAAGIGGSGSYDAIPAAATLPVQVTAVIRLTESYNLRARGRLSYLLTDTSRTGHEPDVMIGLEHFRVGNLLFGYFLGVEYREMLGARFVGFVLGEGGGADSLSAPGP